MKPSVNNIESRLAELNDDEARLKYLNDLIKEQKLTEIGLEYKKSRLKWLKKKTKADHKRKHEKDNSIKGIRPYWSRDEKNKKILTKIYGFENVDLLIERYELESKFVRIKENIEAYRLLIDQIKSTKKRAGRKPKKHKPFHEYLKEKQQVEKFAQSIKDTFRKDNPKQRAMLIYCLQEMGFIEKDKTKVTNKELKESLDDLAGALDNNSQANFNKHHDKAKFAFTEIEEMKDRINDLILNKQIN